MISVITVYNNRSFLESSLLNTLSQQNYPYEVIEVDNTAGQFSCAAAALNYGGSQAHGDILLFVHQDMRFLDPDTFRKIDLFLKTTPKLGIAGVFGLTESGQSAGIILDGAFLEGTLMNQPVEVQTLDECLLIMPKTIFEKVPFDEKTVTGWHCYGVDACLNVQRAGWKAYSLPVLTHHFSLATNRNGIIPQQLRVLRKHYKYAPRIYTSWGILTPRKLFRLWFKTTFLHYKSENKYQQLLFDEICQNKSCSLLNVAPLLGFSPQSFQIFGTNIIFGDEFYLKQTNHTFETVILSGTLEQHSRDECFSLISRIESLGNRIFISFRPNEASNNSIETNDFIQLGYSVHTESAHWKIFSKVL